jgi:hypothetical protein
VTCTGNGRCIMGPILLQLVLQNQNDNKSCRSCTTNSIIEIYYVYLQL